MEQKELINYLFTNKDIKEYCNNNKLNSDEIFDNFTSFATYKKTNDICNNCSGKECLAKPKGKAVKLQKLDDEIRVIYYDCPKAPKDEFGNFEVMNYYDTKVSIEETNPRLSLMKHLSKFIDDYFANPQKLVKGIYLHGNCGSGKSLLMYRFAQNLVSKGIKVLFAYYPDLVREFQNSIGTPHLEELIIKLKKADIVFLDDIGREANTPYIRDEILGPILQYRVDNNLPMFMTSNRSFKLLESHLSETSGNIDKVKGKALIERIKYLMKEYELIDKDFRNN